MILERREARDDAAFDSKRWYSVRYALFCVGHHLNDHQSKLAQDLTLPRWDALQVTVNLQ
jgi:hypothetical protein